MIRLLPVLANLSVLFPCCGATAQTATHTAMGPMKHEAAVPSTTLTITGADGKAKTLTVADVLALPQTSVTVPNGHTQLQETYTGVPVGSLLALVVATTSTSATGTGTMPKSSTRMTVIVARGTDNFRVALTLCDTYPTCRSGQALVADSVNGKPLTSDGAFKLILTEDKMPGRWVRNLDALTVDNLATMATAR